MTLHGIAELEPRGPRDAPREMPIAFGDRSLLSFARRLFLVAHCGESLRGEYLHTLSAVDVATGWCELEVLPNRSQQAVTEALELMRARLPFPLLGIDSDNDSAFINATFSATVSRGDYPPLLPALPDSRSWWGESILGMQAR